MKSQSKLGYEASTILSLAVLAEILKYASKPYLVAELHPFNGGLYKTYSLIDSDTVQIQMNVMGNSALAGDVVKDIWMKAARNPRDLALELMSESDFEVSEEITSAKFNLISALVRLAQYLDQNIAKALELNWGWHDSANFFGENQNLESLFGIPEHWKLIKPVHEMYSWQANAFFVTDSSGKPIYAMNLVLNEAIKPNGNEFRLLPKATIGPDSLPTFPVAEVFKAKNSGDVDRQFWHSSMARYAAKLKMEESLEVIERVPVFEFPENFNVEEFWQTVTRDLPRRGV